jgi:hypothetical protein
LPSSAEAWVRVVARAMPRQAAHRKDRLSCMGTTWIIPWSKPGSLFNAETLRTRRAHATGGPVVEWDGKPEERMPPGMGAWQPERPRYRAATKNQRVADGFPERKARTRWTEGAGFGRCAGGAWRERRARRENPSELRLDAQAGALCHAS